MEGSGGLGWGPPSIAGAHERYRGGTWAIWRGYMGDRVRVLLRSGQDGRGTDTSRAVLTDAPRARQGWDRSMKRPDKTELLVMAAMAAVAILLA